MKGRIGFAPDRKPCDFLLWRFYVRWLLSDSECHGPRVIKQAYRKSVGTAVLSPDYQRATVWAEGTDLAL
jgi:hypothetical protein